MSDRKMHWRSLEQLADDPRAREFLEREFPEGASERPADISRRTMLTLLGASLSMAGLAACRRPVEEIVPFVEMPQGVIPGLPKRYATTMPLGLSAVGLVVTSHEGRPTKIEGNPLHPSSAGATSAVQQAAILDLYDPDRAPAVLHAGNSSDWASFVAAWSERESTLATTGGAGLAILSESSASPTLARLSALVRKRFPSARWVTWDAVGDENRIRGVERITGATWRPVHHLERARVILSLDCDFLMTEGESVRDARQFSSGRRVLSEHDPMNRLYVVEAVYSLTGANADHRLRLRPSQLGVFAAALAARVAGGDSDEFGEADPAAAGIDERWLDAVSQDLLRHRGEGLVVAGRRQPPAAHALAYAINLLLGNIGNTVTYHEALDTALPDASGLAGLVQAMKDGEVSTLVVLGGNPAYDAPADLDFAGAIERVADVVRLGERLDETSRLASWHLPQAHFLEAWGDARAADGTVSVIQPLIEPLFGGKSAVELLGLMALGAESPGHELVRETWRDLLPGETFEAEWNRTLHDGLLAGSVLPAASPGIELGVGRDLVSELAATPIGGADGLDLVLAASPALFDGRWANNAWLQELPDAITKLTWDNAAQLSPATAAALGLKNEDVVRLTHGERSLELPVWIVPGQADETVVTHLGYGRTSGGRVADGVGANAYRLRTLETLHHVPGVSIVATGARYALAQTQDHGSLDEPDLGSREGRRRPLVREASLEGYREDPEFAKHHAELPVAESLWQEFEYVESPQWGMTIDLNSCTGCNACVIACQSENNIPIVGKDQVRRGREMHWIRLDRYFDGDTADPAVLFQAVPCQMCENAPCEQVCPVSATVHDKQGLNVMVYNRCIGTRYCSNNCPYKVRRFNYYNFTKDTPEVTQLAQNPEVTIRSRGVMEKCTYCLQRISATQIEARLDGRVPEDGEIQTACQQACPAQAIQFGDVLDRNSAVAGMKRQDRNYTLLDELYTKPRTSYLAKLRNPNPELADG